MEDCKVHVIHTNVFEKYVQFTNKTGPTIYLVPIIKVEGEFKKLSCHTVLSTRVYSVSPPYSMYIFFEGFVTLLTLSSNSLQVPRKSLN